jgi:hypothetical protein
MVNIKCDNCGIYVQKAIKHKSNFCSCKCFADYRRGYNWNNITPWNKGKSNVYSKQTKDLMRSKKLGNKTSLETRKKMSSAHKRDKTNLWQGGINDLSDTIRKSLNGREWRKNIYARDKWTCNACGVVGSRLHAHHITAFSVIMKSFLLEFNQFSPLEDKETLIRLAESYKPFWDINNGETLCVKCHKATNSYLKKAG